MTEFNYESVLDRLSQFGCAEISDADEKLILFCMEKVQYMIQNEINWTRIPIGLIPTAIDMVIGEFLRTKLTFDPDSIDLDLDAAASEIEEGDTDVKFAYGSGSTTPEERLTAFIDWLTSYGYNQFNGFRKLRW